MSGGPYDAIRAAIEAGGPLAFDAFMEHALYGPGGFYERPPVGPRGDFVTSPHVHPVFGKMVGRAIRRLAAAMGNPVPLRLVEVGAGDGTLAAQILDELSDGPVTYTAVERSRGARRELGSVEGVDVADEMPDRADVVLANELLDNLPFRRIRGDREVRIGLDGDRLVEVEVPWTGEPGAPGVETIVPDGAHAFVSRLAGVLSPGYALLIDYGDVGSTGGDVHGYREHHVVEDPLERPGTADITVGVDFALLAERARADGLRAFGPVTQREAMIALGYGPWVRQELDRQSSLLSERRGVDAIHAWSGRGAASLLVDPAVLGRFRWLVLASPDLDAPGGLGLP
jgi:NADH dehydrogenase [ubiquinone] 1 alpha subcomplex assembly factor 7